MPSLNMLKILVAASAAALFVFLRYRTFRKVIESKPTSVSYYPYIWIGIKLLVLTGCIYYLFWKARSIDAWVLLCLAFICWSIVILVFALRKIQQWKTNGESGRRPHDTTNHIMRRQ